MNRNATLILGLALFLVNFSCAQDLDYSFIRTEGQYFYLNRDITSYEPHAYQILEQKPSSSGVSLFSYKATYAVDGDEYVKLNPKSSFFGDSINVDQIGNTIFHCPKGPVLYFEHINQSNGEWTIWTDVNGKKLTGEYTGKEYVELFENFYDTVANIQITAYDENNEIDTLCEFNGMVFQVSKSYGFYKVWPIYLIIENGINHNHLVDMLSLAGFKKDGNEFGYHYPYNDIVSSLEIGSEIHSTIEQVQTNHIINRIKILSEKEILYSDVSYHFKICDYNSNTGTDTTYNQTEIYQTNYLPNATIFPINAEEPGRFISQKYYSNEETWEESNFQFVEFRDILSDEIIEENGHEYWYYDSWGNLGLGAWAKYQFIENLGVICSYKGEYLSSDEVKYYKTSTEEWGTPFTHYCPNNTGLEESQSSQINIYPNPADDMIYINPNNQPIDQVNIYDLQGREIKQFSLTGQTSLDVSDLQSGIYFLNILSQGQIVTYQKIIIE